MRRGAHALLLVAAIVVCAACALVSGLGDLQEVPCVADCGGQDTASDGSAPSDGRAAEGGDARPPPGSTDGCVPTGPEICTDGLDNDCNGYTDCADPACSAYACTPTIPAGWALAILDPSGMAACPKAYGGPTKLVVDPDLGPATCSCTCAVSSPPSCVDGTVADTRGDNSACNDQTIGRPSNDGGCVGVNGFGTLAPYHSIAPLPPTGGACSATPVTVLPAAGTVGQSCSYGGSLGGGCSSGACAPDPGSAYSSCVSHAGPVACPAGYPNKHSVGTALNDTRACGSCAGTLATTCSNATLSFYTDGACQALAAAVPATGLCVSNPTGPGINSYRYSATTNAQCTTSTPSAPTGSATVAQPSTICCH
jgi:hypothetical protein